MCNAIPIDPNSLRAHLQYEPQELKFGTSGRRGEVVHLTQLEVYINALAELEYLQGLSLAAGGIQKGDPFYFACDLRPSSTAFVPEEKGRGGLAQAISQSICDSGMRPVYLGQIPAPALTSFALSHGKGSMMITGSHIPFDRNGYKTNSSKGELLKDDEAPINQCVALVRERIYREPFADSLFDALGMLKTGAALPVENPVARRAYIQRYVQFFGNQSLSGKRLLAYQHSAVGRDMLVEILEAFGAEVIPVGRSETFVPIDTENIDAEQLNTIQTLARDAWLKYGLIDAVVSTDGDSDRPLLLAVNSTPNNSSSPCEAQFFGGDLVGMIVAEYLGADAVVVPISSNDALDRGPLQKFLEPKTRIGSPFVIAGMEKARLKGRKTICGWEANGGFLTGSDIHKNGKTLTALPTRDALLPILCVLFSMVEKRVSMSALFGELPSRFSRAALLKRFPRAVSLKIVSRFSPADANVKEVHFTSQGPVLLDADLHEMASDIEQRRNLETLRATLREFFSAKDGFGEVERINYIDGVRIFFSNGDVAHVRPSGNADELRIYAVADTQERANAIAALGVAEPNGILRNLAATLKI